MDVPSSRQDWVNHGPKESNSISSPSRLPEVKGLGWKFQPCNLRVCPSGSGKSQLIGINSGVAGGSCLFRQHLENAFFPSLLTFHGF